MYRIFVNDEHVPADEYAALVRLLTENNVDYTERPRLVASLFRFRGQGAGADLMVETEEEYERARTLITGWQQAMINSSRAEYESVKPSLRAREIVGWIVAVLVIGGVLALSLGIGFV